MAPTHLDSSFSTLPTLASPSRPLVEFVSSKNYHSVHYQKIDKYKRNYRGNISIGKFPRDFTDENIPSVYTEGINSVGKFVDKLWTLFIMSITKGITDESFRRYFPESSRTIHFPIALLIFVLYGQNHQRIEKSSVLFGDFLKKFN
jgi:hypothetical protein